jgi:tetratricopeptide (TPR) repeat protein
MYVNPEHKKAQDYMDEQKYDKALKAFNEAIKKSPNHPDILSHRGVCYLQLNQKKNCLDDMLLSLKMQPDYSYRYASLAYAMDYFGNIDGAIEAYEKAIELDPEDAVAYNNLGLLQEKKGYQQKAQRQFEKADRLSKIENKFMDHLDQVEGKTTPEAPHPGKGETLQPKKLEADKIATSKEVYRSIFTDRNTFKEFILFIKQGFKLKRNDQKGKG